MAASIILQRNEVAISLGLLAAGQNGTVIDNFSGQERQFLLNQRGILSPGMRVEIIKYLPHVRFTFQVQDGREKEISLDTATNVWGLSGERHVQLAAAHMGDAFTIKSFSSLDAKDRFLAWSMGKDVRLVVRRIEPVDPKISYMEVEGSAQKILLPQAYSDHIYVRACDICWSCGACMVSDE
jgi:hypothetical protein